MVRLTTDSAGGPLKFENYGNIRGHNSEPLNVLQLL